MSLRNSLLLLMGLCSIGIVINFGVSDFIEWARFSLGTILFSAAIMFLVMVFCGILIHARYSNYKSKKLYNDTNDIYDSEDN